MRCLWMILALVVWFVPTMGTAALAGENKLGGVLRSVGAVDCCCTPAPCGGMGGGESGCGCSVSGSFPAKSPVELPPAAARVILDCFVLPLQGLELPPAMVEKRLEDKKAGVLWEGVGRSCLCVWQK